VTVSRSGAQSRSPSVARGGVTVRGGAGVPRGGIVGPRSVIVGGRGFYRPYYTFRPRFNLGFGLYVGYPIAYPYFYDYPYYPYYPYAVDPYPYGYAAPSYGYSYSYPAQPYSSDPSSAYPPSSYPSTTYPGDGSAYPAQPGTSVGVQRGGQQSAPGGVSFEITPETAAVFVDGTYVGTASDFGPSSQPLGLIPGRHKIEIRASGYRTMTFDAEVTPGQVIPYQATLQRD
jgi:hypothetical protein